MNICKPQSATLQTFDVCKAQNMSRDLTNVCVSFKQFTLDMMGHHETSILQCQNPLVHYLGIIFRNFFKRSILERRMDSHLFPVTRPYMQAAQAI